jgi:hypothetical protein
VRRSRGANKNHIGGKSPGPARIVFMIGRAYVDPGAWWAFLLLLGGREHWSAEIARHTAAGGPSSRRASARDRQAAHDLPAWHRAADKLAVAEHRLGR